LDQGVQSSKVNSEIKPQVHRAYNVLHNLWETLKKQMNNLGPATTSMLKKETDGRQWCSAETPSKLKSVLEQAVKKCEKYWGILQFAKSARIIVPC